MEIFISSSQSKPLRQTNCRGQTRVSHQTNHHGQTRVSRQTNHRGQTRVPRQVRERGITGGLGRIPRIFLLNFSDYILYSSTCY
jgi:hypothetical protein